MDGSEEPSANEIPFQPSPVHLNEITFRNKVVWSLQALAAPELLETGVPLYAYQKENALEVLGNDAAADAVVDLDWYVGTAIRVEEGWMAYPVPAWEMSVSDIAAWLQNPCKAEHFDEAFCAGGTSTAVALGEQDSYVVSNLPLADLPIQDKLWIPRKDWLDALGDVSNQI